MKTGISNRVSVEGMAVRSETDKERDAHLSTALRIVRVLESYGQLCIRQGVDRRDVDAIAARYEQLRFSAGSFEVASDQAKAEWVAGVLRHDMDGADAARALNIIDQLQDQITGEGWAAFACGSDISDNPYVKLTPEHDLWVIGWLGASALARRQHQTGKGEQGGGASTPRG